MASGIALNQLNNLGMVTYEGVNTVMMQQSSRFLLKQFKGMSKGKKCEGYMEYLNNTEELIRRKITAKTVTDFIQLDHLERALATRAVFKLKELD